MKNPSSYFLLLLICFSAWACDSNLVFEENLNIEDAVWDRNEKAKFAFQIEETGLAYNFYLNFRHSGKYPYRNLYLFTRTESPSGKVALDTAQMLLASPQGRWMGKGIGDLYDYQFRFKEQIIFPDSGEYHFEIEQAMREKELPYVTDIGIRIEKVESE
ncbi:MAG: gliding motility lipoprotein GldH [Vicingaceae bacterium]